MSMSICPVLGSVAADWVETFREEGEEVERGRRKGNEKIEIGER